MNEHDRRSLAVAIEARLRNRLSTLNESDLSATIDVIDIWITANTCGRDLAQVLQNEKDLRIRVGVLDTANRMLRDRNKRLRKANATMNNQIRRVLNEWGVA